MTGNGTVLLEALNLLAGLVLLVAQPVELLLQFVTALRQFADRDQGFHRRAALLQRFFDGF